MVRIGRRFVPQSTIDRRVQAKDDRYARELRARFPRLLEPEVLPYASVVVIPADADARAAFHAFLTNPATSALLDAQIADNARVDAELALDALHDNRLSDAQLLAERDAELEGDWRADREGDACGTACGFCGRCS